MPPPSPPLPPPLSLSLSRAHSIECQHDIASVWLGLIIYCDDLPNVAFTLIPNDKCKSNRFEWRNHPIKQA